MGQIKLVSNHGYKIGIDEVKGLKDVMIQVMKPVQALLLDKIYWGHGLELNEVEYKSRDGFIAHSHNCGGIELSLVIPECESSQFTYLEFGQWDGSHYGCDDETQCECSFDTDGHYDAFLRIRLKFEGIEDDKLKFYLFIEGGNEDAPYFRSVPTLFETEFTATSVTDFKKVSKKYIKKALKFLK